MPGFDFFAPLMVFAFSSLITPGPNNIIIATSGANFGYQRTLPVIFGVCFGFAAMVLFVTFGLAGVFIQYPVLQTVLRAVGFAFMLYLAWKIAAADIHDEQVTGAPPTFAQMVLFQWVNPKAWAMSGVAAVAFTTSGGDAFVEAILIALVFLFISLPCQLLWGAFGAAIGDYLRASRRRLRVFNCIMAALMVGAFVPAVLD